MIRYASYLGKIRQRVLLGVVSFVLLATGGFCEDPTDSSKSKSKNRSSLKSPASTIELFDGMEQGTLDVKVVAMSSKQVSLLIKNLGDEEVDVQFPATFAAVPVLAQMGNNGNPFGNGNRMMPFGNPGNQALIAGGNQGQAGQALGGGFPQGQGVGFGNGAGNNFGPGNGQLFGNPGGGFNNRNGGMFRVEEGATRKLLLRTVCLEHGKPDPNPRKKYRLVKLDTVSQDPLIHRLCEELSDPNQSQNIIQAAAWHTANQLSWEDLARKYKHVSQYTGNELYFTPRELDKAQKLVESTSRSLDPVAPDPQTLSRSDR